MNFQNLEKSSPKNIGLLLLASPQQPEQSEFSHSVIVVINHKEKLGSLGLILNKPLRLTLNDFSEDQWENFENVPVFKGGPVEQNRLIVTALEWDEEQNWVRWHLNLKGRQLSFLVNSDAQLRLQAFCGYVGWQAGQLEKEIQEGFWLPAPVMPQNLFAANNKKLWEKLMSIYYPLQPYKNLLPNDPSFN